MFRKLIMTTALIIAFSVSVKAEERQIVDLDSYVSYLETNQSKNPSWVAYPKTQEEMDYLMKLVYTHAPKKVIIKSSGMDFKTLKEMYWRADDNNNGLEEFPLKHSLLIYTVLNQGTQITLNDNSVKNGEFSTKHVIAGVEKLTTSLAEQLVGETDMQSLANVSEYMFNNFEYNPYGWHYMTLANLHSGEMACQGITYFSKMILDKMGIETEVRLGYSHYWLVATIDNQLVTYDPTTDIILGEVNITLGMNSKEHLNKTQATGMYDSSYEEGMYTSVDTYQSTHLAF